MKLKFIYTALVLIFYLSSYSQHVFNKEYFYSVSPPNSMTIHVLADSGYVSVGFGYMNNILNIEILFTDTNGDFVGSKHYGSLSYDTNQGVENSCINLGYGYALPAFKPIYESGDTGFVQLYRFNEVFDTLWTRKYFVDTNWVVPRGMCATADGGFMIVGEFMQGNFVSDSLDALMLKVDSSGNLQWSKLFGTTENYDSFWKVVQTPDGGYLVGGSTASGQENIGYFDRNDWYVVKTDSQGNEAWSRRYGGEYNDGRITTLLMSSDTCYYITGAYVYDNADDNLHAESYIVKLDKNFNEVYQLKYDNQQYYQSYIMDAIEDDDHNIVLLGDQNDDGANEYYMRATMHKMTPVGDILWKRQYIAFSDTTYDEHRSHSIKMTSDGGYVFGGDAFSLLQSPYQQNWLVKTDSMGCDGTDWWPCGGHVQINPTVANSDFKMYPNPSKNILFLEIKNDEFKILNAEIYELTGKLVKSFPLEETEKGINISSLPKGLYFVKLGEQTQKLVVE